MIAVGMIDDQIIAENDRQRKHEAHMATIEAETTRHRLRVEADNRESRRVFMGYVLVGIAIVTVISSIIIAITINASDDRAVRQRDKQRQQEIAEVCIREKNIWLNGDCIPAHRES